MLKGIAFTMNVFYDTFSPAFTNILKFILIQDPVKIALGICLGLSISRFFSEITNDLLKPFIHSILQIFSKSGFSYRVFNSTFNFGGVIEQIAVFFISMILFYYLFIIPIDDLKEKYNIEQKTFKCPYCMTLINIDATRCPACTSQLNKSTEYLN